MYPKHIWYKLSWIFVNWCDKKNIFPIILLPILAVFVGSWLGNRGKSSLIVSESDMSSNRLPRFLTVRYWMESQQNNALLFSFQQIVFTFFCAQVLLINWLCQNNNSKIANKLIVINRRSFVFSLSKARLLHWYICNMVDLVFLNNT